MPDKSQREARIAELESLPDRLRSEVAKLSEAQLEKTFREGGWNIRQLVHHLADSHMNGFVRAKLAVTEDEPTIKPYSQDEWSKLADVRRPIQESLDILAGLHARWAALFRSLPDDAWSRIFVHPERGKLTLDDLLRIYSEHGRKHIEHIRAALAR